MSEITLCVRESVEALFLIMLEIFYIALNPLSGYKIQTTKIVQKLIAI